MELHRLIYVSTAYDAFSPDDVRYILSGARENNRLNHITGLLLFSHRFFLQVFEGSRENINQTYALISQDRRHHTLVLINYSEIIERDFEHWSMGYVPELAYTRALCLQYSIDDIFRPYEMSAQNALGLMKELRQTVPCE